MFITRNFGNFGNFGNIGASALSTSSTRQSPTSVDPVLRFAFKSGARNASYFWLVDGDGGATHLRDVDGNRVEIPDDASPSLFHSLEQVSGVFDVLLLMRIGPTAICEAELHLKEEFRDGIPVFPLPGKACVDGALRDLLIEYGSVVMPLASTIMHDRRVLAASTLAEWIGAVERLRPSVVIPSGVQLTPRDYLSLHHRALLPGKIGARAFEQPTGYVIVGAAREMQRDVVEWMRTSPIPEELAFHEETDRLLYPAAQGTLIVAPSARMPTWEEFAKPHACIREGELSPFRLTDAMRPGAVVLISAERLASEQHFALWKGLMAQYQARHVSVDHSSVLSACHRFRERDTDPYLLPLLPEFLYWQRLVVDDATPATACAAIRASLRLFLSEDGVVYRDSAFQTLVGHLPLHRMPIGRLGAVHRIPRQPSAQDATLHGFAGQAATVPNDVPPVCALSSELSQPAFVQRLSGLNIDDVFTAYGAQAVRRASNEECAVCMSDFADAFLPCGHRVCVSCARRLPCELAPVRPTQDDVRAIYEQRVVRRCPCCRAATDHAYVRRCPRGEPRTMAVAAKIKRLATARSQREVWVVAHWMQVLKDVNDLIKHKRAFYTTWAPPKDAADVTCSVVRFVHVPITARIPASNLDANITILWCHPPCFSNPYIDSLNAHRALTAAGEDPSKVIIVANTSMPTDMEILSGTYRRSDEKGGLQLH